MAYRMAQDCSLPATAMAPELTEDIVIAMCIHFMEVRSLAKKSLGSTLCGAVNKPSRASANSQLSHCTQPQSIPKQPVASSSSRNEIRRLSKLMFMCVGPLGLGCVHPVQSVNNPDNFPFTQYFGSSGPDQVYHRDHRQCLAPVQQPHSHMPVQCSAVWTSEFVVSRACVVGSTLLEYWKKKWAFGGWWGGETKTRSVGGTQKTKSQRRLVGAAQ